MTSVKQKEPKYKYDHIMLVDDNELDNFVNKKVIESSHFSKKVYVSTSSKSALEFLKNIAEMGEVSDKLCPQVIFIDLNMPLIDGFTFIDCLKEITHKNIQECRLIILTSSVQLDDKKKAEALSSHITFLTKPLTEAVLRKL